LNGQAEDDELKKEMDMDNYVNKEYYLPILKEFCKKTMSLYECGYPQGPFIPYTMPKYKSAPIKIMYVGRDTWEWTRYNVLDEAFKKDCLEDYLKANASNVYVEKMLEWRNNSGAFWTFANKLHLLIRTGNLVDDLADLSDVQKNILKEVGYGNLNSIEIPETIKKRKDVFEDDKYVWDLINNVEQYNAIRKASKPFETLKSMIDAYHPDYVFVLTWIEKGDFFEGLEKEYEWKSNFFSEDIDEKKYRAVYTSNNYKTKVIWSLHPNSLKFKGFTKGDTENLILFLANTLKEL